MDLIPIIHRNKYICEAIELTKKYKRQSLYVSSGAIAQTVWNAIFNNQPEYGIDDIDIVYFNNTDLTENNEIETYKEIRKYLSDVPIKVDVKNQARVHCWYEEKFGYAISPVLSIEDSIGRFPTTSTAIGIHYETKNEYNIIIPFGTDDLFSGIIRANKKQITKEIYEEKAQKWKKKWPGLRIIDW